MAIPVSKNQEIALEISGLGSDGQGIGRVEGYALFVPGALPGERVRARVIKTTASYGVGRLMAVLLPSADRAVPECPAYGRCGGCSLQHMSYAAQLAFKERQVRDALTRIGGFAEPPVRPILGAAEPWRYRNKAAFPAIAGKPTGFGMFAPRSHRIVHLEDCLLQNKADTGAMQAVSQWAWECGLTGYDESSGQGVLRHLMTRSTAAGEVMVVLVTTGPLPKPARLVDLLQKNLPGFVSLVHNINRAKTNVITGDTYKTIWGADTLTETLCGLDFSVSPASFLQVNHRQTEALYETALQFAALTPDAVVVDLYCGIGTLSLCAAKRAKEVVGVEIVPQAIENARKNAERNGLHNTRFLCGAAEEELPRIFDELKAPPDVVLLDPPRKGCDPALIETLLQFCPQRLVYVSCNPATLARDLKLFKEAYSLQTVQPVDMFPQTAHVETVVLLTRGTDLETAKGK